MKPLPKEFQFKCDEHSREQCEMLGIFIPKDMVFNIDNYYTVDDKCIVIEANSTLTLAEIISLSDYIESNYPDVADIPISAENLYTPNCIRTYSGHYLDPFNPDPSKINIIDIAHHLSNTNRWAGATEYSYNVANHSLWVASMFDDPVDKLCALLHDASEAYIGDMPKPIKDRLPDYKKLEEILCKCIANKYSCVYPWPSWIYAADHDALHLEWDNLILHKHNYNLSSSKVAFIETYKSIRNSLPYLPEINK